MKGHEMILATTHQLSDKKIVEYKGLVTGEVTAGINVVRDLFASLRNIVGGRVVSYEKELIRARESAIQEMQERAEAMGANAILGIAIDYETLNGQVVMVAVTGTAVVVE